VLKENFLFYFKSDKDPLAQPNGVLRIDDAIVRFGESTVTKELIQPPWILCIDLAVMNGSVENGKRLVNNPQQQLNTFLISGEHEILDGWLLEIKEAAAWWTKKSRPSKVKMSAAVNENGEETRRPSGSTTSTRSGGH
jgi:hypothetical protein